MIIGIEEFLSITDKLVIDMRTKEEYEAGHIIGSINFEILSFQERKQVSILYNEGLNQEAYMLAYEYALEKLPKLFSIIKKNRVKSIVFYCARGGSRSSIVYEVFKSLKGMAIYKIKNGYKSYRQFVNAFFSLNSNTYESMIVYENLGVKFSGKCLNSDEYLLLDLRKKIESKENPFRLLDTNMEYFNSRLLNYFIFEKLYYSNVKKIVFILPILKDITEVFHQMLRALINDAEGIYLSSVLEDRIECIRENYLEKSFTLDLMLDFFENKRKEISNAVVEDIIESFKKEKFNKGIELVLLKYHNPIMDYFINKNNLKSISTIKEIKEFLESWSE